MNDETIYLFTYIGLRTIRHIKKYGRYFLLRTIYFIKFMFFHPKKFRFLFEFTFSDFSCYCSSY